MVGLVVKEDLYDIIKSPVVTEKSTACIEYNKYVFRVAIDATKQQVKKAVELAFGVKVESVNTIKMKGKQKRFRGRIGQRSDFKKAIVTLSEGQSLDMTAEIK